MSGFGRPTSAATSVMPCSSGMQVSACSEEKQMPRGPIATPRPSMRRNLSLAVTAATPTPACDINPRMVSPRTISGSVIMISAPLSRSRAKLPAMPCTAGGAPVTIDRLFGLVKVGIVASATT